MRELLSEFKELRLHGMAGAWEVRWSRSFGQSPGRNKLRPVPGIWF